MNTDLKHSGFAVSSSVCGFAAIAMVILGTLVSAAVASTSNSPAGYGVAFVFLALSGLVSLWGLVGGIIALNNPGRKGLAISAVVLSGASLLRLLFISLLGASS